MRGKWQEHAAPFYASVDLRNSRFKLAPVDTNLFPGGFKQSESGVLSAVRAGAHGCDRESLSGRSRRVAYSRKPHAKISSTCKTVAILQRILRQAGMTVAHRQSLLPDIKAPTEARPARRRKTCGWNRWSVMGKPLDWSMLRSVPWCCSTTIFRAAVPDVLRACEQALFPPLEAGWATRPQIKATLEAYKEVATEFAQLVGIDPWFINPYFEKCGKDRFPQRQGEESPGGLRHRNSRRRARQVYGIRHRGRPLRHRQGDAGTYGPWAS